MSSTLTVYGLTTVDMGKYMLLIRHPSKGCQPERRLTQVGLALSGSNQARKGRLVDALAARGDEGRDTLR